MASNDMWAAGTYIDSDGQSSGAEPMLFHWDGATWAETDLTQPGVVPIGETNGIKVLSRNNAWVAGGYVGANLGLVVLHWDGNNWLRVPVPNPLREGEFTALGVLAPGRVWAMGFGFDDEDGESNNLSAHFDGGHCPGQAASPTVTAAP